MTQRQHFRKAVKEGSLKNIIRDILRKTLEEDTASHAVYPAEQGRRMTGSALRRWTFFPYKL